MSSEAALGLKPIFSTFLFPPDIGGVARTNTFTVFTNREKDIEFPSEDRFFKKML